MNLSSLSRRAACSLTCSSLPAVARNRLAPGSSRSFRLARTFSSASTSSSPGRISYNVAVSCSGKGRRFHPLRSTHVFDPTSQEALGLITREQNPSAREKLRPDSGADAFFVSRIGQDDPEHTVAFAVADGVGGWEESRVDPGDFSHGLCSYMAESALASSGNTLRAKDLMQMGYDQVLADQFIRAGASTASVGIAGDDGRVELANLGDSGSVLLRSAAVHHYSIPQTHGFNTPYQLSVIPPRMRAQAAIFGGAYLEDYPRDAAVTDLRMQHGDVLMLASDGVFDNLNNQDILKLVTRQMVLTGAWTTDESSGAIKAADNLAQLARRGGLAGVLSGNTNNAGKHDDTNNALQEYTLSSLLSASITGRAKLASLDRRRDSPFAKEYQRHYPYDHYRGGKADDICVLVLIAVGS